jgi:hypothetical protein
MVYYSSKYLYTVEKPGGGVALIFEKSLGVRGGVHAFWILIFIAFYITSFYF